MTTRSIFIRVFGSGKSSFRISFGRGPIRRGDPLPGTVGVPAAPMEDEVGRVVHEVVDAHVDAGRATLEYDPDPEGPTWLLVPSDERACEILVQLDAEEQVTLYVGDGGTTIELFESDPAVLLANVRCLLRAAVDGKYSEVLRATRSGELAKARGIFGLEGGRHVVRYTNLSTLGRRLPRQRRAYIAFDDVDRGGTDGVRR